MEQVLETVEAFRELHEGQQLDFARLVEHMPPWVQARVVEMLLKQGIEAVLAWTFRDFTPRTVPFEQSIELENYEPICKRVRRTSLSNNGIIKEEVSKMLEAGVIRPSMSPWCFAVVIVKKKDGKARFCVDFRELKR